MDFLCSAFSTVISKGLIKNYVVIRLLHCLVKAMMVSEQGFFSGD